MVQGIFIGRILYAFISFGCSKFLYAKPETSVSDRTDSDAGESAPTDGKYELFAQINTTIKDQLKDLILNGVEIDLLLFSTVWYFIVYLLID